MEGLCIPNKQRQIKGEKRGKGKEEEEKEAEQRAVPGGEKAVLLLGRCLGKKRLKKKRGVPVPPSRSRRAAVGEDGYGVSEAGASLSHGHSGC